jgi:malate dehydrogenase (quinone)
MSKHPRSDVALVGGGIMSATLGSLLKMLIPDLTIRVFERLPSIAFESSQSMNNAGTGHAGNCELNYTPEEAVGSVDVRKALKINAAFEVSLQFWTRLVETGDLPNPRLFLNQVPQISFVWGASSHDFLRARYKRLSAHPMFGGMEFSDDPKRLAEWMPLIIEGRRKGQILAATRVNRATDIDFGELTRALFSGLSHHAGLEIFLNHEVNGLERDPEGRWRLQTKDVKTGREFEAKARFVFLGSGGGTLPLLQKSGIPEARGYGGFPVSGQWLVCKNESVIARHGAKVYGKAALGAPPMSVPHLDTRYWKGIKALLFGPFAGFTTKYLKQGSSLDLIKSLNLHNIRPMLAVAWENMDLNRYLILQALQSQEQRMEALKDYMPRAVPEDWELATAGQRVQIIKPDPKRIGKLEFGTEVVTSADGSLAALLGASPGASTAVDTMLEVVHRCFPKHAREIQFRKNLKKAVPSYGKDLIHDLQLLKQIRDRVDAVLGLGSIPERGFKTAGAA